MVLFINRNKVIPTNIYHASVLPVISEPVQISDEEYDQAFENPIVEKLDFAADEKLLLARMSTTVLSAVIEKEDSVYTISVEYHPTIYQASSLYDAMQLALDDNRAN